MITLTAAKRLIVENLNLDGSYDMEGIANDIVELVNNTESQAKFVTLWDAYERVKVAGDLRTAQTIVSDMYEGELRKKQ